jgi:hypothetical protein
MANFNSRLPLLFCLLLMTACSSLTRNPVPLDRIDDAQLAGLPNVRTFWSERSHDPAFQKDLIASIQDEPPGLFLRDESGRPVYSGLAISGGGSTGAFGAGVLCGWTAAGTRPTFKLVTGISTGALIAPYAFAGPEYDDKLRSVYTTVSTKDIAKTSKRPPWNSEALQDSTPLADLIANDVNEDMLADIATAHARGQRLYIGTVNLAAQRFVIWNMGAIAASQSPGSLQLFRNVMLASASIPGAFPPVMIEVEVGGETFDEMHVDGGTITQVFFYEFILDLKQAARESGLNADSEISSSVYVLRNGKAGPEPKQVKRDVLAISGRALSTMIKSAALNDLIRIYHFTRRDQINFNFADVPGDWEYEKSEQFDQEEMNALFDLGYRMSVEENVWRKSPIE